LELNNKILTCHPQGENGVCIEQSKYDMIRGAILKSIQSQSLSFSNMTKAVKKQLQESFEGSINWYTITVKLDLEAKGEIYQNSGKPETYSITRKLK